MSVYTHREDDYLTNALSSFSFGTPATPAPRLDDTEVGPTEVTPRPSVIATPFSYTPGTDLELSSDDDVFDYDDESMRIEISSARYSDGRRASPPSEDLLYERERENSVATLRHEGSAFQPSTTATSSASATSANNNEADLEFDMNYITDFADGSSNVSDIVRRPSAISLAPTSTATPRGSAGQSSLFWSWGGLVGSLRRPSTATVATSSSGGAGIFQHDDSFARNLLDWGGEGYREQRKDWTFRREREEKLLNATLAAPISPTSGSSLFSGRPNTADREDRRGRSPAYWKGMPVGSQEIWRNDTVGGFIVSREEIGRKPDQESVSGKAPQQRLFIRDSRYRDSRSEHPPVIVHKHSKTTAFSISRYYKPRPPNPQQSTTNVASPRPSTATSAIVPSPGQTQQHNRKIILLATRKVQEAFTSTQTTGMLADHGLLAADGERDREKEKHRKQRERSDRERLKEKGKEKEHQTRSKSKERRKSVLTVAGRKKITSQHSSASLKESDRGTKSEGFVSNGDYRFTDSGPSDSDVGVMSAPERLRPPPSSSASSASGHTNLPPIPLRHPEDTSMPYDSSASASSTTSLQSTSASTSTSVSTSASTYAHAFTPSSSGHRYPPPPPPMIRKQKPRRRPYDHEHDGYNQDWEEDDEYDDDDDDYLNENDYDVYARDPNDPLYPRRGQRRRSSRTPHSETYSVMTIPQFNNMQKQLRNHHHLTFEGKLSLFDRLTGKVTGKALSKDPSTRDVLLRASGGRSFEPPWVTFPSRDKQEEQRKVINSLNHSFQDVGLLPTTSRDIKQKDKSFTGTKDSKKRKEDQRRGSTRGSSRYEKQGSDTTINDYDVFANIPPDSLYMLLPLWPGDTDYYSQREYPYPKAHIPPEKRMFLLVCYKELESADPSNSKIQEGSRDPTGRPRSNTSSGETDNPKKDEKNVLLPGFIITARHVTYGDLQGSGVKAPDEGITVFGPMEEAIRDMPGTAGLEGYDTTNYWGMGSGPREDVDESIFPGSLASEMNDKILRAMDTLVGVCHSRESGVEFDPEALRALGLCRLLNPLPRGKIAEEVEEEQRKLAMRCKLTPVGKAVVQMIWIGGLALMSFGPA